MVFLTSVRALGIQGNAPKTWPRCVWLRDIISAAFDDTTEYKCFSDQMDAFVIHMGWPKRTVKEKSNDLKAYEISKDPFLKGLQACLELYFYGMPIDTVCYLFM
jgi:hypothetical protein